MSPMKKIIRRRIKKVSLETEEAPKQRVTQCVVCNTELPVGQGITRLLPSSYGGVACRNCFSIHHASCVVCGARHLRGVPRFANLYVETGRHRYHRRVACTQCATSLNTCARCGLTSRRTVEATSRGGRKQALCLYCIGITEGSAWGVHPPRLSYHFSRKQEGYFYGIELETDGYEARSHAITDLNTLQNNLNEPVFWMKGDGSLHHGIEICFHPRTVKSWTDFLVSGPFLDMKKIIEQHGGKAYDTNTSGLHIHREGVGIDDTLRFKLAFFFSQCSGNLQKIAQRTANGYCSFTPYRSSFITVEDARRQVSTRSRNALTLKSHHGTIEFRLFKGTLAPKTLAAQIGISDLLLCWLKSAPESELNDMARKKGAMWDAFMKAALVSSSPATKFIHELLTRKGFFTIATQHNIPLEQHGGVTCAL